MKDNNKKTLITVLDYDANTFVEKTVLDVQECLPYKDQPTVTWINVDGLDCPEVLAKLDEVYCVHHLLIEDIKDLDQRPKMIEQDDHIFVVARMLSYESDGKTLLEEQVSFILGVNFLITFQENKEGDVFEPVRQRLRTSRSRLRMHGADHLLYALLDAITDKYFTVVDRIGERLEALDEGLLKHTEPSLLHKIGQIKKDLLVLRRSVWPLRDAIHALAHSDTELVRDETRVYFHSIHDHVIQVADTVEILRDTTSSMLDIYLSSVSFRLNEVMKVLTIIATVFMPLTFIAGLYGMNFNTSASPYNMPELTWPFGYVMVLGVMAAVAIGMLVFFKNKKWI
jgi:magnesium transporter